MHDQSVQQPEPHGALFSRLSSRCTTRRAAAGRTAAPAAHRSRGGGTGALLARMERLLALGSLPAAGDLPVLIDRLRLEQVADEWNLLIESGPSSEAARARGTELTPEGKAEIEAQWRRCIIEGWFDAQSDSSACRPRPPATRA